MCVREREQIGLDAVQLPHHHLLHLRERESVCVRESERDRDKVSVRERERVCVWVCA